MQRRTLILHAPVIHAGYLDFLKRNREIIEELHLVQGALVEELSEIKPDIASLDAEHVRQLLQTLGFADVFIFDPAHAPVLAEKSLLLINDKLSRTLRERYFPKADVAWDSTFLRWDTESVHTEEDHSIQESNDPFDQEMMRLATKESEKSSDWWRQVGAVLVNGAVVLDVAHNEGLPSDHTPYQRGAVRDLLQPGERPDLVDTIHAEQKIIASAAKEGRSLKGASLYITHFPCPVCAKLIVYAGIAKCYFAEGYSTLRSAPLLAAAGVMVARVVL